MPIDLKQLLEMFEHDNPNLPSDKKQTQTSKKSCKHKFIPLFNSISCEFCGVDQEKKNG